MKTLTAAGLAVFAMLCLALLTQGIRAAYLNEGNIPGAPRVLECSQDDTLVFVAMNVTRWAVRGPVLEARNQDGTRLARQMLPNETCVDRLP